MAYLRKKNAEKSVRNGFDCKVGAAENLTDETDMSALGHQNVESEERKTLFKKAKKDIRKESQTNKVPELI